MSRQTKKTSRDLQDNYYKKSLADLQTDMDRVIGFVERYFTKTSIILGVWGVVLSIFFEETVSSVVIAAFTEAIGNITFWNVCFLIISFASIVMFIIGISNLCLTLIAKAKNSKKDSKIFYTDISLNETVEEYKYKLEHLTEDDIRNDYINQIYINSKLCKQKNDNYNRGVFCTLIGFGVFVLLLIIKTIF